ncbi:hypothetical protein PsorP6_012626 [Peronosclerospora sorghi]|uniref:Uncharacterized protein n=1 Tax=Peronosclerospora sorghi TaxID=230839 RepID=A0ACC0WEW7_9STRA|nr:hypothetical protein PsorP6_012626 [Peronosclerospora sorghi]
MLFTHLNYAEEVARAPQLVIALNPRTQKLNLLQMECKLPLELFENLMEVATDGCTQIYDLLQNAKKSLLQLASYEESFFVIDKLKVIEKALGDFVVKLLLECPWSIPYTNHDNRYQKHKNKNQTLTLLIMLAAYPSILRT